MVRSEWKVLSVDDDPEMHEGLKGILSSRMGENTFEFTAATTFDEGMALIGSNRFDLIFLDVHEDSNDPDPSDHLDHSDQRGEQLLATLKSSRFVPVIFYTGFPAKVSHLKSHIVKVVDKGAPPEEVRSEVNAILKTGLPHLAQYIEEQSRAYIWDNLEELLKQVADDTVTSDIALLTARNLAKNLSQRSVKELLGNDTSMIDPLEMYLFPADPDNCSPADIYRRKEDDALWMVLTPACDFEQDKAENVLLARVVPLTEHELYKTWKEKAREFNALEQSQQTKRNKQELSNASGAVKNLVKNNKGNRFRFLPGTFFLPNCIVDFQQLLNLPKVNSDHYEVVCSLDNPYREEVLQLFSNYYGRIGTPDYEFDSIWEKIDQEFSPE
ncbi:response regulator [Billgrantia lactosivorans]|uniref:response regulator n=1 Tax=Billgrantia lactosivorans TaxID=2185141 RepID=UPI000DABE5EB|nr:response regulator [Halomonas lactosivorans]